MGCLASSPTGWGRRMTQTHPDVSCSSLRKRTNQRRRLMSFGELLRQSRDPFVVTALAVSFTAAVFFRINSD